MKRITQVKRSRLECLENSEDTVTFFRSTSKATKEEIRRTVWERQYLMLCKYTDYVTQSSASHAETISISVPKKTFSVNYWLDWSPNMSSGRRHQH